MHINLKAAILVTPSGSHVVSVYFYHVLSLLLYFMFPHFTTKGDIIHYLISKACGRISGLFLDGENVSCVPTNGVLVKEPGCEMIP